MQKADGEKEGKAFSLATEGRTGGNGLKLQQSRFGSNLREQKDNGTNLPCEVVGSPSLEISKKKARDGEEGLE